MLTAPGTDYGSLGLGGRPYQDWTSVTLVCGDLTLALMWVVGSLTREMEASA